MPFRIYRRVRVTLLVSLLLALAACSRGPQTWQLTNVSGHMPDLEFTLTGGNGEPMTAADLKGKVLMMFFGYTHCPDVCPLSMTHLHMVMQQLGDAADQARIVFVSVDPQRDTPPLLHQYVRAFDKHAVGLTGDMRTIRRLTKTYRVVFDADPPDPRGNYEVAHSSAVFVFDRDGRARLVSTSTDNTKAIAHDVRQLIEEKS